ncbi:MAG: site-specific integrase [Acidimicrobiaceae bacterium]|nr:site-specific integrase [Acidimicrobiaceae bacterium]
MAGRPGRPLKASLKGNRNGTVTIRIPKAVGSTKRVSEQFPNLEVGERWRAAALAARKAGLALPDPEPYRAAANRRTSEVLLDGFADVAWAWWQKFYPVDSTSPERVDDVEAHIRLHLIPFFGPRVDHIRDITYEDCEDFVSHMSGKREKSTPAQTIVAHVRELTLAEAATWCGKSKSGVRKAWMLGKFPTAYLDTTRDVTGVVRVPIGDLIKAGYVPNESTVEAPYGYSPKQVNALLSDLRQMFKFAMAKNLMDTDPSLGIEAKEPVRGSRSNRPRVNPDTPVYLFDLVTSKRIASGLHIHHQMAFWLMRCAGLRISEAFGITLGDIYHDGGEMTIRIWRQGGKTFKVVDEHGLKKSVSSKDSVKTIASNRVLPMARQLAELIDLYLEVFHDGETDLSTPFLRTAGGGGQSGYRDALEKATLEAKCGTGDVGFHATPHTYRKFFATDLDDINPRARSVYMGHKIQNLDGGAAITESTYTLRKKGVQHVLVVAETMTTLIESSIVTLVEPTPAGRLIPASACPNADERDRAFEVLETAGYISVGSVAGEEVIDIAQASELLCRSERTVVQLARDGFLVRQRVPGAGRSSFFGVTMTSVKELMASAQQSWSRKSICAEFNLAYHQVEYLIKTLGLVAFEASASRGFRYLDSEVDKIREYLAGKNEALENAASLHEATKLLSCSPVTVRKLLSLGRLERDDVASAVVGLDMVTRISLERLRVERSSYRTLPVAPPPGSIHMREAQKRTGFNRVKVLELKSKGVIIHRTADYQFHLDETSLERYLAASTE